MAAIALLTAGAVAFLLAREDGPRPALSGSLYHASGSYIGRLDLGDGQSTVVADLGEVNVQRVDRLGDGRLLLSVEGPIHDRMVARVMLYDPDTRDTRPLFAGRNATFVPGRGHVVFERNATLLTIGVGDNPAGERVIERIPRGTTVAVVPLNRDRFLYALHDGRATAVRLQHLDQNAAQEADALGSLCDLSDALWLTGLDELLCRAVDGPDPAWLRVSLDGTVVSRIEVSAGAPARLLAYLPAVQSVLYARAQTRWFSGRARTAVWAWDVRGDAHALVARDRFVGDTVAYRATR